MKLTEKDFRYFKEQCQKYADKLGLNSWRIYYFFQKMDDIYASCQHNYKGRVASITLNKDFDTMDKNKKLQETALHEMLELLFSSLGDLAGFRTWDEDEYEKENHIIIRTLEKLLL